MRRLSYLFAVGTCARRCLSRIRGVKIETLVYSTFEVGENQFRIWSGIDGDHDVIHLHGQSARPASSPRKNIALVPADDAARRNAQ